MDSKVILVVDDEEPVRLFVRTLLERDGYAVLLANDGDHALEVSRRYAGEIRMLLTDYKMPQLDGLQLAAALMDERPGISVIIMSGHLSRPEELTGSEITVLPKPFSITQLLQTVKGLM
jgi:DNA-binding NtrC family response regulator